MALLMEQIQYLIERLDKLDEKFDDKLTAILAEATETKIQTTKTNGRVNNLDRLSDSYGKDIEAIKKVIGFNKGRDYVVIAIIGLVMGFMVSYILGGGNKKEIAREIEKDKIENNKTK